MATISRRANRQAPVSPVPNTAVKIVAAWPDRRWYVAARRRLLRWYAGHKRDLPWRENTHPYRVWISEIMLQQTQVATVIGYFQRFVAKFPNIDALAAASEQDVLRLWEGLGYYRRARQLHRAAQVIATTYDGRFPQSLDEIRQLPGIGRYTAGAIASIAFDKPAPILEANTVRLYSRLVGLRGDVTTKSNQAALWHFAEEIVPRQGAGTVNQALMELGSLICMPVAPKCEQCPLRIQCAAAGNGLQREIPAAKRRPSIESVREATVVVWSKGKVLLRMRGAGERWASMWDFPRFPLPGDELVDDDNLVRRVAAGVAEQTGIKIQSIRHLTTIKHGVTRFRITLECFEARAAAPPRASKPSTTLAWHSPEALADIALSVPARKVARQVAEGDKRTTGSA